MTERRESRRDFLRLTLGGAVAAHLPILGCREPQLGGEPARGGMPYRTLGKTGEKVSILCIGGYHIGVPGEQEAIRIMQEAIDAGVNFLDNAWEYHAGESEVRMGKAIRGRRDKVFLMTKHHGRDRKTAMAHLEDSLRRLGTDRIDLWQFHEVIYDDDPDRIFAEGGGIEAAVEARQAGKVRYIGFTGHKDPRFLLKMLEHDFEWDAAQMPLNCLDPHYRSFEELVLPILVKRRIGVIGMKSTACGAIPQKGIATTAECLHYVMSLPVSTVCTGCDSMEALGRALAAARSFKPLSTGEVASLLERTKGPGSTGAVEGYKSTTVFDGPVGRKQHNL